MYNDNETSQQTRHFFSIPPNKLTDRRRCLETQKCSFLPEIHRPGSRPSTYQIVANPSSKIMYPNSFIIVEIANDDDSKVILTLLDSISVLGQIMGGGSQYSNLFPLIEQIMQNQQQQIRVKTVETYEKIIRQSNIQKNQSKIILSLKNVLSFEYQESKQGFFAVASKMLGDFSSPNQQFLLSQYQLFAESPLFQLRRFAAMYSKYLVEWLSDYEAPILKIVEILFKDKDQSNKIYLVDTIITLSKYKNQVFLQAYFNLISYQFPWRVRYELISKIDKLGQVLGTPEKFRPLLTYMVKYINDIQPEIRSISCLKLKQIIPYVESDDVVNKIIPALKSIPQDNHIYVRNSLAKSLLSYCSVIGKKNTSEHILPKFLQLLKDEEIQIRLTIFNNINEICEVLGVDTLSQTTVPAIAELAQHQKWRVRSSSIDILFYLIKKSGKQFLNQKIVKQVLQYTKDQANAVRKQGIKLLSKIQLQFGSQWFEKNIMIKIIPSAKATNYIQRQTFIQTIEILFPYITYDYMVKNISPLLHNTLLNDPVENVKITLCRLLKTVYQQCARDREIAKKSLRILNQDKDRDVKQAASKVLKQIQ